MVHTVIPLPGPVEQFLVVNRSSTAYVTTAQGQVRLRMSINPHRADRPTDRLIREWHTPPIPATQNYPPSPPTN